MKKETNKEVISVDEVKGYDEKVSDYEKHFDDIGMHDPSTEAAIAQMKTATPREARVKDGEEAPQLQERAELRESKKESLEGARQMSAEDFPSEQKKMNEKLSADMKEDEALDDEMGRKKRVVTAVREEVDTAEVAKKEVNKKK